MSPWGQMLETLLAITHMDVSVGTQAQVFRPGLECKTRTVSPGPSRSELGFWS